MEKFNIHDEVHWNIWREQIREAMANARKCSECEMPLTDIESDTQKDMEDDCITCSSCCYLFYK